MTKRINAIKALTPSIKLQNTAQNELLCKYISRRSSLNAGEINNVLMQLQDAILFFTLAGHPVKLDGLGTFTPTIRLDGSYNLNVRIDRTLIREMNQPGEIRAEILNRKNIGLSADNLVAQWNALHPDDPVA